MFGPAVSFEVTFAPLPVTVAVPVKSAAGRAAAGPLCSRMLRASSVSFPFGAALLPVSMAEAETVPVALIDGANMLARLAGRFCTVSVALSLGESVPSSPTCPPFRLRERWRTAMSGRVVISAGPRSAALSSRQEALSEAIVALRASRFSTPARTIRAGADISLATVA